MRDDKMNLIEKTYKTSFGTIYYWVNNHIADAQWLVFYQV